MAILKSPSTTNDRPSQANIVGSVASTAAAYVTAVEESGFGAFRQTKLTFSALPITITDNGSNGSGGIKIYDFPKGAIAALGGSSKLTITYGSVTDANLIGAIGTATAGADATLTSTEANFIQSTTCPTTSGTGTLQGVAVASPTNVNGTSSAASAYLNLATSSDPGTNNSSTVSGWVILSWATHGDVTLS